jgi:hypothetical protein
MVCWHVDELLISHAKPETSLDSLPGLHDITTHLKKTHSYSGLIL